MKKLFLISMSLIFLVGCTTKSQYLLHPIDKAEKECISNTSDTLLMNQCSDIAQNAWENEITKILHNLKTVLDKESYKNLIKAQKSWEQYKNDEFYTIDTMLSVKQGTMYSNVTKGLKVEIVKQRALKLQEYLNTIND